MAYGGWRRPRPEISLAVCRLFGIPLPCRRGKRREISSSPRRRSVRKNPGLSSSFKSSRPGPKLHMPEPPASRPSFSHRLIVMASTPKSTPQVLSHLLAHGLHPFRHAFGVVSEQGQKSGMDQPILVSSDNRNLTRWDPLNSMCRNGTCAERTRTPERLCSRIFALALPT